MRLRSIRSRVLVLVLIPLLSLIGLYAFATALTASNAVTLARARTIKNTISNPIGLFEAQIQTERLLATVYLGGPTPLNLGALTTQEVKTDKFLSVLRATARSASARDNASPQVTAAVTVLLRDSADLPALRRRISSRAITGAQAQNAYSAIVAAGYQALTDTAMEMPDAHLQTQALAIMRITQGAEILFQEQALYVGDVMARRFPPGAHQKFAALVGAHRGVVGQAMAGLDHAYLSTYQRYVSPTAVAGLTGLENAVINTRGGVVPRVPVPIFERASTAVAAGLDIAGYRDGPALARYGDHIAQPVSLRLILAGGLGLLAIVISVIASVWIGRGLVRELGGLRRAALELAEVRLPDVVARLSSGEEAGVDIDAETPFPNPSHDEIGQVRQAFNSVQRTAIEAAVGQARLRAGVATVFRNLARRSQSLLHRQLSMLDDLELQAAQPEALESLFQIDHLTTRMRRHAEGLVVLAGDRPGRGWKKPVPLADVLRAAVAEIEDYRRVRVVTRSRAALAGPAVADVIHLLAELIENAAIFSPPNTPVRITGDLVGRGFAVEVEDRGLGITEQTMAELNAKLADPPQMDLAATEQLGLYVAARLAREHRIRITLRDSPFGGTSAVVFIPTELVVSEESYSADPEVGLANDLAVQATGRHAARGGLWARPSAGGDNGGPDGRPSDAFPPTLPARTGPFAPGPAGNGAGVFAPATPDAGEDQERTDPSTAPGDLTELGLPRRTRQASLAPELRNPQPSDAGTGNGAAGARAPGETRDAFTALQRGWERGREDLAVGWPGAGTGAPESGQGDDGGNAAAGPAQEGAGEPAQAAPWEPAQEPPGEPAQEGHGALAQEGPGESAQQGAGESAQQGAGESAQQGAGESAQQGAGESAQERPGESAQEDTA